LSRARGRMHVVNFRRRREGRTDYAKRLALLKSGKPRMVVRKSNKYVTVQFVKFGEKGDETIASATTMELKKIGFPGKCNTPSAYLAGIAAAKKARAKGVGEFVLDIGRQTASRGSIVFAALKGALDAGLKTSHAPEMIPSEDRIKGSHLNCAAQFEEARKKITA